MLPSIILVPRNQGVTEKICNPFYIKHCGWQRSFAMFTGDDLSPR